MSKKYMKQVMKELICSKERKKEIEKQLRSEFSIGRERGENEYQTVKRLGDPEEFAAEFNQSFSEEEKKTYKKEKWTKRIIITALIVIVLGIAVWWVFPKQKSIEQSEIFEKDTVEDKIELVIECLETDDYETLKMISNEEMDTYFEGDTILKAKKMFGEDWGERVSFGNLYAVEVTQMRKTTAVIQQTVAYENTSVVYTLSFNPDMELIGLWLQ